MLDWIFGDKFIVIAIIISAFALMYFFAKYKAIRGLIYGLLYFVLLISAVGAIGHLNNYYSATGGVVGELSSILKKNQVEITEESDDIYFNFKNVVLMENTNGKYSASMTSDSVMKLDANETYFIYVNEQPCTTVQTEERDIYATYSYAFLNREDGNYYSLADDTMTFYVAFYDNYTYLYIEVENGADTYQLWNSYFNKNNFKVRVTKVEKTFYNSAEYSKVNLMVNNELYKTIVLKNGIDYKLPEPDLTEFGIDFSSWVNDSGETISEINNISADITLYAYGENVYRYAYYYGSGSDIYYGTEGSIVILPDANTFAVSVGFKDGEYCWTKNYTNSIEYKCAAKEVLTDDTTFFLMEVATVTYYALDEVYAVEQYLVVENVYQLPTIKNYLGYQFNYWQDENGNQIQPNEYGDYKFTEDTSLYANMTEASLEPGIYTSFESTGVMLKDWQTAIDDGDIIELGTCLDIRCEGYVVMPADIEVCVYSAMYGGSPELATNEVHIRFSNGSQLWHFGGGYINLYMKLKSIDLSVCENLTIIYQRDFKDCYDLESIILSETITEIQSEAFANCTSLKSIYIPETVTEIAADAFTGSGLTQIIISENNTTYKMDGNSLIYKATGEVVLTI